MSHNNIELITKEVSHPTLACPHPELWHCYDSEATEIEVLHALYALVIMLKPKIVIETGCYKGYGSEMIATGMAANNFGEFHTTDIGVDMVGITTARLREKGVQGPNVFVHQGTGVQLIAKCPKPVDFAFLDSGADETRMEELRMLFPYLSQSAVVAVHDTGLQHGLRSYFLATVQRMGLQYFMFDTPRGFSLVRKPWNG